MTTPEFDIVCNKFGRIAYNMLPVIESMGWEGNGNGFTMYLHWEENKNLIAALICFVSSTDKKEREKIRTKIKKLFYGGEEGFERYKEAMFNSMKLTGQAG